MQKQNFIHRLCIAAGLFLAFCGMYCFTVPELDVFVFAKDYGASASLFADACSYGNGRLLGNLLGFFFSLHYPWAFLLMASGMTAIVLLLNRIAFGGSLKTVFPVAIALAFPSAKMVQDVYGVFAAFTNYVLPVVFILTGILLLQQHADRMRPLPRVLCGAALFLSSAAAALFSENTTIVLCTFAVLTLVSDKLRTHRLHANGLLFAAGTLLGTVCMALLPTLTHSTNKLSDYRGTVLGSFGTLVKGVFGGILRTCGVLNTFFAAAALLSFALLLHLHDAKPTPAVRYARTVLAVYPLLSLLLGLADLTVYFSRALQFFQLLPTCAYVAALLIAVWQMRREARKQNLFAFVLVLSSVVPMLFVSNYGYRTYYITFILMLLWACMLFGRQRAVLSALLGKTHLSARAAAAAFACVFVVIECVYATQSAINFDVYALRTEQIGQALENGEAEITVPLLPCKYVSGEDSWPYSVRMALPDDTPLRVQASADFSACRDGSEYVLFVRKQPLYALQYAVGHRQYMDPLVLNDCSS